MFEGEHCQICDLFKSRMGYSGGMFFWPLRRRIPCSSAYLPLKHDVGASTKCISKFGGSCIIAGNFSERTTQQPITSRKIAEARA